MWKRPWGQQVDGTDVLTSQRQCLSRKTPSGSSRTSLIGSDGTKRFPLPGFNLVPGYVWFDKEPGTRYTRILEVGRRLSPAVNGKKE
jgi:hypothetical protein